MESRDEKGRKDRYIDEMRNSYLYQFYTTLNLKTFNYPLTTSNAFDHICRQQTYGFA